MDLVLATAGEQEIGASSYQVLANNFTLREFSYVDLELATNKFDDEGFLSSGLLGSVHKGYLVPDDSSKESTIVAVTRFNMDLIWSSFRWFSCTFFRRIGVKPGFMGDSPTKKPKTFEVHMNLPKSYTLGCLQHPQLVKMIGYCLDDNHVFLVNEFISGGSLEDHLFGHGYQNKGCQEHHPFSWNLRLKVALQAAKGLTFLHSQKPPVIHGDVRVGNILLDQDFNAKLSDFGLVDHRWPDPHMGLGIVIAPEKIFRGSLSTMSDVFSFGVVLLVMLSGLRLTEIFDGEQLAEHVSESYEIFRDEQTVRRLADNMGCPYDPDGVYILASLISSCFYPRYHTRPKMTEVVECLERLCKHHQISNDKD
ncbi:hypothetical protein Drorol1_Dr00019101 [Drosera rotundifolia]